MTCGWWIGARGDPYDMSRVYEEFAVRAMIGQEMADKESKDNAYKGYVDPHVRRVLPPSSPPETRTRPALGGISPPAALQADMKIDSR
jgi:hypothetical protein